MFPTDSRFLVVDDSKVVRDFVKTALYTMGMEKIDICEDGKMAEKMIFEAQKSAAPYSLVLLDINMPHLDGLGLLEILKEDDSTKDIPIIMMTTEGGRQTVLKAVMSGVHGYMVKPFGVGDIKKKIQEVYQRLQSDPNENAC